MSYKIEETWTSLKLYWNCKGRQDYCYSCDFSGAHGPPGISPGTSSRCRIAFCTLRKRRGGLRIERALSRVQKLSLSMLGITVVIVTRGRIRGTAADRKTDCASSPGALCYTSSSMLRRGICCFCANAFCTYINWSSFLSITDN